MEVVVESCRKKLTTVERAWPGAVVIYATSKGIEPRVRFSQFFPHGKESIPLPSVVYPHLKKGRRAVGFSLLTGSRVWAAVLAIAACVTLSGCCCILLPHRGDAEVLGLATDENVLELATVLMSEASVGNEIERVSVAWTVLNRMARNGKTRVADVVAHAYARNQRPSQEMINLARRILESPGRDPTSGATHFYSPRNMPKEGERTDGFDVGGGLEATEGLSRRNYRPVWAKTYRLVAVPGVRPAYYKFYVAPGSGPVQ